MPTVPASLAHQAAELRALTEALAERHASLGDERLCCYDVTATECRALNYLRSEELPTITALAEYQALTRSGTTRLVDRLEEKGYAKRLRSEGDGRVCCVGLTPAGRDLLQRIDRDCAEQYGAVLESLAQEERRVVLEALRRLVEATHTDSPTCGVTKRLGL